MALQERANRVESVSGVSKPGWQEDRPNYKSHSPVPLAKHPDRTNGQYFVLLCKVLGKPTSGLLEFSPMTRLRLSSSHLKLPTWIKSKYQQEEERRAAEVSKRLRELREAERLAEKGSLGSIVTSISTRAREE